MTASAYLLNALAGFEEIWFVDFEFISKPGERPDVLCLCAHELRSGQCIQLWEDQLGEVPPYRIDKRALFVCFAATAECACHLALGWPLPARVLDLSPLFRCHINGRVPPAEGKGMIGALRHFRLDAVSGKYKDAMRDRILKGRPYSQDEIARITEYCLSDVVGLPALLEALLKQMPARTRLPTALHWGEFVAVSAAMEHNGVPIDMEIAGQLFEKGAWSYIRAAIVPLINAQYGVYVQDATGEWSFSYELFEAYLARAGIAWPRHDNGKLDLREKTFNSMAKAYPQTENLRQLRYTLAKLRKVKLAIGRDGRNRTVLWPFAGKTARSQPRASQWIFSPAVWLRGLIKPAPGRAIAYIDWSGMEFQIAAALSNCRPMLDLYATGIPYIGFAQRFDEAPPGATKKTHGHIHERYKVGCLGAQYGMQSTTLAQRLGISAFAAHEMLSQHRGLFSKYWAWVEDWIAHALNTGTMNTTMGWTCCTGITELNARSIGNWPTQATGADILRVACVEGHRRGLRLCGSVHDAVLIESSIEQIDADVELMREIMMRASRVVLGAGYELRTGVDVVRYPDRFVDTRGTEMWNIVLRLLEQYQRAQEETGHVAA
ncbi:DNA polymerase [Bradyrhizobium sp. F1.13.3]|uniref:DNA polymerase n=1 Tax=Bradyrhizobium sp. F1.13.3 TaxID=3156351 RepID=UPI003397D16A